MKIRSIVQSCFTSLFIRVVGYDQRDYVSRRYIKGEGIEIGALNNPLRVRKSVVVRYVDRLTIADLTRHYPNLDAKAFVKVDVVDDAAELGAFKDESQDFVIANHFLEHCQNPVHAMKNMLRVLKNDGILFLAVPDKRHTFDSARPVTTLAHVMADYTNGPGISRSSHLEEWVRLIDKVKDPLRAKKREADLIADDYSIHYHVWTQTEILEFFLALKSMFTFEIELFVKNGAEVLSILRKGAKNGLPGKSS